MNYVGARIATRWLSGPRQRGRVKPKMDKSAFQLRICPKYVLGSKIMKAEKWLYQA